MLAHREAIPDRVFQVGKVVTSGFVPSNPTLGIQGQISIAQEQHKSTVCHTFHGVRHTSGKIYRSTTLVRSGLFLG